jgi:phosphoglycolate phosphatase
MHPQLSICGDEVSTPKPSALPLEILCERTSLTPKDCIVVGDTTGDTGMARNARAGMCVGVLTGSGTAAQLLETGADVILPSVGHLPGLLSYIFATPLSCSDTVVVRD